MANKKISDLTANTAPDTADLFPHVDVSDTTDAPTGTTKKTTGANLTKAISNVVGDSGSGGTKGLVPAPGAGDAAAGKFLKADGTFAVPSGTGAPTNATYITQVAESGLSAEQALASLATGIVKNTTTTGVLSIADVNDISSPVAAADSGSTDTYVATLSPVPTGYVTGANYRFKANTANTGACTINFNSLGAKTIKKVAGGITTDLADNDIRAGQWVDLVYDGTNMQMQSTLGNAASGGSPGGSNTQFQYNNSGAFGGAAGLTYNSGTAAVTVVSGAFNAGSGTFNITSGGTITHGDFNGNNGAGASWSDNSGNLWHRIRGGSFGWFELAANRPVYWSPNNDDATVDPDTALKRTAQGVVEVNGGISGDTTGLLLLRGRTIANLPASPVTGMIGSITDGDAGLAWGATAVNSGAGATKYAVWYNGSAWTVIGK